MPPLEARTDFAASSGRDPILRFRERMNKPIRKFNAKHYQSLDDFDDNEDSRHDEDDEGIRDDITSFSSLKLARDQDKPKHLGTWKSKRNDESVFGSLAQTESQLSSLTQLMGQHTVLPPANSNSSNNENTAHNFSMHSTTGSIRPLAPPRSHQREALGKIDPAFVHAVQRKETIVFQSNKHSSNNPEGILSFWGSPFDQTSLGCNKPDGKSQKLPDTLPSPKENRHPQSAGARMATSSERNFEEETTDARAALVPSSAMNLIQCWARNSCANPAQQETREISSQISTGADKKDPLLVALQVVRLKRELKKLRNGSENKRSFNLLNDDTNIETHENPPMSKSVVPPTPGRKSVRFSQELVTEVRERPFTEPEDMDKLYFVYGELEELEFDRSTVEHDQFECIIQEESNTSQETYVEVEHNSRKLHSIGDDGLPHSLSDLSFY